MNTQGEMQQAAGAPATAEMSFTQRLTGIYFEPKKTFESINRKPSWLGIFIVVAVLGVAVSYALTSRMDYETYMRKAMQMNPWTRNMPEEQIEQVLSRPPSAFGRYSQIIFAPVGMLVVYCILAGVFLLVYMMMGASIPFKKSLAVTIWGMAAPAIVVVILSIIFIMTKDPATLDIDPAGNVASNLGLLVSRSDNPGLASLLSSIDLFSFWSIFLLAVGYSAVSDRKLTTGKAAIGIIVLWAVYVAGKTWFLS